MLEPARQRLALAGAKLPSLGRLLDGPAQRLSALSARLRPNEMQRTNVRRQEQVERISASMNRAAQQKLERLENRLSRAGNLLEAYSYQGVLARGYALVTDSANNVVRSQRSVDVGDNVILTFHDGKRGAVIEGAAAAPKPIKAVKPVKKKPKQTDEKQADLF